MNDHALIETRFTIDFMRKKRCCVTFFFIIEADEEASRNQYKNNDRRRAAERDFHRRLNWSSNLSSYEWLNDVPPDLKEKVT